MRVTEGMRSNQVRESATQSSARLMDASSKAASGLRVGAPADDPAAFAKIARQSGLLGRVEDRIRSTDRALGDISMAESTLSSAEELLSRARELAVQMADGGMTAEGRAVAAKEVTEIRQALVGIANTRGANGYIFAGTATQTPPVLPAGTFVGNDNGIQVEVGEGISLRQNASGARAFTAAGGRDILQDLADFELALTTNNVPNVQAMVDNMDAGRAQITRVRAEAGIVMDRMRTASTSNTMARGAIMAARADEAEIDATEAYTNLAKASQAYERSLEITRKMLSLMSPTQLLAR